MRTLIEFILPAVTYRIASGAQPATINGQTYEPLASGEVEASGDDGAHLVISIPASHPLAQRCLDGGVPHPIFASVWRTQESSGQAEKVWSGDVSSLAIVGRVAKFLVSARSGEALERKAS